MTPLVDAALRATLVLAFGLGLRALLRRQPAALRHALVTASLVAAPAVAAIAPSLPGLALRLPAAAAVTSEGSPTRTDLTAPARRPAIEATSGPLHATPPAAWPRALAILWGVGAVGAASLRLGSALRLRRRARTGRPVGERRWTRALDRARERLAITGPVDLRSVPERSLLATWGWRRPRIVIPDAALAWSDARIAAVLAHELAHVLRRDWLVQSIADTAWALLWWNPLAWLAARRLRDDAELACDDAVLRAGIAPATYADHLLDIARACGSAGRPEAVPAMARPSTLERRIVAMLNPRLDHGRPTRRTTVAAAAALVAMLLPVALLRAQGAPQPLEGVIYDQSGAVVPGVTLTLVTGTATTQAMTDPAGRFVFDTVDAGAHVLQAKIPGFRALRQELLLKESADWNRAVTLPLGEVRETISVTAPRPAAIVPLNGPVPVRVGGNIRAPRKLKNVPPLYPERMRDAGLEALVEVEAVIDRSGAVANVRVVSTSVHPDFAQAATDAVRQWRFEPTLLNGTPVDVVMTVSVHFGLS
jgi:TonB family protein